MAILQRLGLRRRSRFDPQTPLDAFLDSPLQTLISALYALLLTLRGRPYAPPTHNAIRVVCLADTHDLFPADPVPEGDLLIHAGDLSTPGTAAALQAQIDFLAAQPHTHKVLVAGNHDAYFDPNARSLADRTFRTPLDLKGSLVARRGGPLRDLLPSGAWVDALKVAAYGLHAVVFKVLMLGPGGNTGGTWLVNAGLMKGNSGKLGNPPQVVVL
ncbi:hypothetical protein VdG2_01473 [Verticillium dahliae VDG2]|nr:hypothetical protein VdG2_01473 [Verticillium dahliae VDG2]